MQRIIRPAAFNLFLLLLLMSTACGSSGTSWVRALSSGYLSEFNAMALDSRGNIYAVGYIRGDGDYNFGTAKKPVIVSGPYDVTDNAVMVKYSSNGTALWARSVVSGTSASKFSSVAVDSSGNVYAAGIMYGTGSYTFGTAGNEVTAAGTSSDGYNLVLVKYSSDGVAQWACSADAASADTSNFFVGAVEVDSSDRVYVAGVITETGSYDFGNSVTANGTWEYSNSILVQYNSAGTAQWARSVFSGTESSAFNSIDFDADGNVYAAGTISKDVEKNFGTTADPVTVTGPYDSGLNAVLVKYASDGTAQWARSLDSGPASSSFSKVVLDSSGNIYACGNLWGTGEYNFGTSGVPVNTSVDNSRFSAALVKYNAAGAAQWAASISAGPDESTFKSLALDSDNTIYAVGYIEGDNEYNFGTVGAPAAATGAYSGYNLVAVQYSSAGVPLEAYSADTASNGSTLSSVLVGKGGTVYGAGYISGSNEFTFEYFGGTFSVTGPDTTSSLLIKY